MLALKVLQYIKARISLALRQRLAGTGIKQLPDIMMVYKFYDTKARFSVARGRDEGLVQHTPNALTHGLWSSTSAVLPFLKNLYISLPGDKQVLYDNISFSVTHKYKPRFSWLSEHLI